MSSRRRLACIRRQWRPQGLQWLARLRFGDSAQPLHQYAPSSRECCYVADHNIEHALILLSHNGQYDLSNLNFDNFFARSYDKTGVIWYTASIVVTAPGDYRIRRSIVAGRAGTTKTAAFQLLMLDVETKLDAVLRGKVSSDRDRPSKQNKRKGSAPAVSIISKPLDAMAPPKLDTDECNTWSGAPLTKSPKSNANTSVMSHSPKSSQGTQKSFASSQLSKNSQSSQSTAPSVHVVSVMPKMAHQPSMTALSNEEATNEQRHHERHTSTPLHSIKSPISPTRKMAKHRSQPLHPRSATALPQTLLKTLPPLPKTSTEKLRRPSIEKPPITAEPEQIHPALRDKSHSTEGLKPAPSSQEPSLSGSSSVFSRSPVSPMDDVTAKRMQPLHIDAAAEAPSPPHFEKQVSQVPARFLKQVAAFEIYV